MAKKTPTPKRAPKPPRVAMLNCRLVGMVDFNWSAGAINVLRSLSVATNGTDYFWENASLIWLAKKSPAELSGIAGCSRDVLSEIRATIQYHLGDDTPEAWR